MTSLRKLSDGTVAQGIVALDENGYVSDPGLLIVPANCQMLSIAGPTAAGQNQITEIFPIAGNANGIDIYSFYTQVIQIGSPGNVAQTLIVAAASAPVDFQSKLNCFSIYRTFQDERQSGVALGGFAPMNVLKLRIPPNWGLWQIASITGDALTRNNMRFGLQIK